MQKNIKIDNNVVVSNIVTDLNKSVITRRTTKHYHHCKCCYSTYKNQRE